VAEAEAHPPMERWFVEIKDGAEWMFAGARHASRDLAIQRLRVAQADRRHWVDGEPVEYRLVRETTTYTVDPVATATEEAPNA
jgi:hypothetical protein